MSGWKTLPPCDQPLASTLFGPNPRGSARAVNLAVRHALQAHQPDAVIVACSGGPDSMALAAATIDNCARMSRPCYTITVDHGLRPHSRAEADGVAHCLQQLGATQAQVVSITVDADTSGPEGGARDARYQALRDYAATKRTPTTTVPIVLGHTMDDQAETVLLGFARGSGATSIRGMSADGDGFIRPLLTLRRADTVECCRQLGLDVVDDPTNYPDGSWRAADGSPLRRSAIRHRVLPAFSHAVGHDVIPAVARTATMLQADDDALHIWAHTVAQRTVTTDTDDAYQQVRDRIGRDQLTPRQEQALRHWDDVVAAMDARQLVDVPLAVRTRVIKAVMTAAGSATTYDHVMTVDALITDWHGQQPVPLPGHVSVQRIGGTDLVVVRRQSH